MPIGVQALSEMSAKGTSSPTVRSNLARQPIAKDAIYAVSRPIKDSLPGRTLEETDADRRGTSASAPPPPAWQVYR